MTHNLIDISLQISLLFYFVLYESKMDTCLEREIITHETCNIFQLKAVRVPALFC